MKGGNQSNSVTRGGKKVNAPLEAARHQFEYIADEEEIKQPPTSKIPGFEANSSKMSNPYVSDLKKQIYELERQLKLRDSLINDLKKENATVKAEK